MKPAGEGLFDVRRWEWVHWAPGGEPGWGTLAVYMRSVVWAGKARDTFSLGDFRQSAPSLRFDSLVVGPLIIIKIITAHAHGGPAVR